jgi:hypothetical protein
MAGAMGGKQSAEFLYKYKNEYGGVQGEFWCFLWPQPLMGLRYSVVDEWIVL